MHAVMNSCQLVAARALVPVGSSVFVLALQPFFAAD